MKIKNLLNKRILGTIPLFALILVVAGGGIASAALLQYYGTITGFATVKQSVLLDDHDYSTKSGFTFDGSDVKAGTTVIEKHHLKNTADVEAKMYFKTGYKTDEESSLSDSEPGITTKVVEYFDDARADIPAYEAPSSCDVNVSSSESIQTAIDDAGTGDTICVESGTYSGQIDITVSGITLASLAGPDATTIDGTDVTLSNAPSNQPWASLVAITASDVTFKGFTVTNSEDRGIGIYGSSSNVLNNIVLDHNTVTSNAAAGIQAENSQVTVKNNKVTDNGYDGFVSYAPADGSIIENNILSSNGPTGVHSQVWHDAGIEIGGDVADTNIEIVRNTIENNVGSDSTEEGASVGAGIYLRDSIDSDNSVTIKSNDITGNSDYGIASKADASGISVSNNNIVDNGLGVQHTGAGTLDATNNYWGTDGISTSENVDATWKKKASSTDDEDTNSFTLGAGKTDHFGIINDFAIDLKPLNYTITTKVKPGTPTE